MTSTRIVNAAPLVIARGIDDQSTTEPIVESPGLPTHLPKVYLYAAWGETKPMLVAGAHRTSLYSADTFDTLLGYANHQTALSNVLEAAGNAQVIERIVPDDAGPKANFLLSLDIVRDTIPSYKRNADGSYARDLVTGQPIQLTANPDGTGALVTVTGYRAKWVLSSNSVRANEATFGQATMVNGDQVSSITGVGQSKRYPILEVQASCYGLYGVNAALRLWAPTTKSNTPVNDSILTSTLSYPLRMSVVRRPDARSSVSTVPTLSGAQYVEFVMRPNSVDPLAPARGITFEDLMPSSYRNMDDRTQALKTGDFGQVHLYRDNLAVVQQLIYTLESVVLNTPNDLTQTGADGYMVNVINGTYTTGVPYYTYLIDTSAAGSIRLTETTNLFAAGGTDGTMSDAAFSTSVGTAVAAYADETHPYMDDALYPESVIYDTGFTLLTKRALCQFISVRKDTFVALSTHTSGQPALTADQEYSVGQVLKGYAQMYAESDYFGTSTRRAAVFSGSGEVTTFAWRKGRLPLSLEVARMAATMMGGSNGVWKSQYTMDKWPNTRVSMFKNSNITTLPASTKNLWWSAGINWVQAFDQVNYFFPAVHTVCDDDTSIFTSFITAMGAVEMQKTGMRVHRMFTGSTRYTDDQFKDKVNEEFNKQVNGRFAGLFRIIPDCQITAADKQRGYSWTLPVTLAANGAKTVMTLDVRGVRMSSLTK